jgi:hypothetical protein
MQQREDGWSPRSALEMLLARSDDAAIDYVTDALLNGTTLDDPPPAGTPQSDGDLVEAG